jgi:hypothetical protein
MAFDDRVHPRDRLGRWRRANAVLARLEPLSAYRQYGEGYDRTVATHAHDAERMARAGRVDEAEHWAKAAEEAAKATAERRRRGAIRRGELQEAVAYYGRMMGLLTEKHGWQPSQAHLIATRAGTSQFGEAFGPMVVREGLFGRFRVGELG